METASKNKKNNKKTKVQWKMLKFLFFAYIIVMVIWLVINNYLGDKKSIYQKIGYREPYSVSTKDALIAKESSIVPYANYIKAGDTLSAYNMLTEEYKKATTYEEYLKTLEGIDFETFDMKEIKMKAEGTYVATIVYDRENVQEETEYLLFVNEVNPKIITISPNKFIYSFKDLKFKEDNIELTIQSCNIYIDSISMTGVVRNKSMFETMEFKNIGVGYGENSSKIENFDFSLKPGESKEIKIEYNTNYFMPNNIILKRLIDESTLRTYTFYVDNTK